jgi:hypothetical protein
MNTALVPDYKQSIYDLSQSVVLEDIRISGNIHTLKGLRPEQGLGNVPSWCIDWSSYDYWAEDQSRALADVRSSLYAATADTRPNFVVFQQPNARNSLGVQGRSFDEIVECDVSLPEALIENHTFDHK